MKLSQISYQRVYPLGSYSTERIGLEATLDEGENPETALSHLKILVEELHQETMKSLPKDDFRGTHVRDVVEENPSIKAIREEMLACTKISETNAKGVEIGLMAYAGAASKYPELNETYLSMLEKLGGLQTYSE